MEAALGVLKSKKKPGSALLSICLQRTRFSAAMTKPGPSGAPSLVLPELGTFTDEAQRASALAELVQRNKLAKYSCIAMLPANSYQLVQVDLGELPVDERREAARWQIRERLDYPPEEAVIDLFEVAPFGGEKRPLTYVVSASSNYLREQVQALSKTGLTLAAIDIPEFALRNICDLFTEDERGLALLWLEEHSGLLVVVRDGSLYLSRSFNSGMADLVPYADGAYESLTEQLDSIVLEIQRSFDFCESTFQLPMVSRLLIAQTGQEISAIYGYLNEYLTTKVEPLSFSGVLTTPEGFSQVELNGALPVIGGALRREQN